MAETFAFISGLLEKLAFLVENKASSLHGLKKCDELLNKLISNLQVVRAVLIDADERRMKDQVVKVWLMKLEDVVYDADDLVDEISFDSLKREVEAAAASKNSRSWASSIFSAPSEQRYVKGFKSKMGKILARLDEIANERETLALRESRVSAPDPFVRAMAAESTSFVMVSEIYGREHDTENIIMSVLADPSSSSVEAIGIIGMGGVGKTTLAQLVFNDHRLKDHFDLRIWVCVSDEFDIRRITATIVEAVTGHFSDERKHLDLLQRELRDGLAGKRFILVLDDIWCEDYARWEMLKAVLNSGARGSKILITTRIQTAARAVPCSKYFYLKTLSDENCWAMFKNLAFEGRSEADIELLEGIGREIVEKCRGLPLAVKTIAGLLRFKRSREDWLHVLHSTTWELSEYDYADPILQALQLSYNQLPAQLKRCFAYCAMFPKAYKFDKETLVLLWMAQGFLQQSHVATMEEVGFDYLNALLSRSIFQAPVDSHIELHDLMNDLAQSVSEGLCSVLELDDRLNLEYAITRRTRHLLITGNSDALGKFGTIANSLRTLFLIDSSSGQIGSHLLEELVMKQKWLRALSLSHCQIAELPTSIGKLKHLRYLDLSHNTFIRLPESLCTLYFLQTLILTNCFSLVMLPKDIVNLVNLRHLHLVGTGLLQMPEDMGRLRSLQTLTKFVVGRGGSQISELGALPELRRLSLSELQNVSSASDASKASLKAKRYLNELQLEWSRDSNGPTKQREVLENLEPGKELKILTIRFYGGIEFPSWLGDPSLSNILFLHLSDSDNCSSLPPLGQLPSLEHLIIERINGVTSIGHEFYGEEQPFLHLKRLEFKDMSLWEQWISPELEEGSEFPCLQYLHIQNCPNMEGGLPKSLPSLLVLEISNCQQLKAQVPSVPESCELKLYGCDLLQQRNEKMPMRSYDEIASVVSSIVADQISIRSYDGFSRSSSSLNKNRHDAPPTSEVPKVADQHDDQTFHKKEHDDQIQVLSGEDGKQHFSSENFKVSSMTQLMDLPLGLLSLRIESCDTLHSLPTGVKDRSFEELYIIDCISFKTFPLGHLATSLKTLYIRNCRNLEFPHPKELNQFTLLEDLCLGSSCDSLKSFPLNCLPKLKTLSLWDCRNLEYLAIDKGSQNDLKSLDALEIRDCPNLTTFPKEGLQAPSLTSLVLSNCSNLKSLPRWMQSLSCLQSLHINKCPELESLPSRGLPSSLKILCINFCDKITPQRAWELDKLDSLCHFEIEGGCKGLLSFPEEGLLPTNLKSLRISRLLNLKCLDEYGIQKLTSLQTLEINCCNELRSFPEDGLPSSLSFLRITDCSVLKQKLQKRKGKEWFKIAHIASIHIDE